MSDHRLRALRDPNSAYYQNICRLLARAQEDEARVAERRARVVIPFKVSAASLEEYARRFNWKIEMENHGLRSLHTPHVAGLVYCMAIRNLLALGRDGEEVIALDPDLPALVAKGAAYVRAVRTNSSNALQSSYAMEESQLERLAGSKNAAIAGAANAYLAEIRAGGGGRICMDPRSADISGDVLLIDHTRTSISLAQAVVTAREWQVTMIRGVCFFQPEMLAVNRGRLAAFPGEYVIDDGLDLITYIPDEEPETRFSHRWSALRSFFMNHECVMQGETWLVEKHLGRDGIFHYAAHRAVEPWEFPVELGANYYSESYAEWVELKYPTRGGVATGVRTGYWRRDSVRMPKSMYDNVISAMMAVEPKNLTKEQVLLVMRNMNCTVVVHGDTVKTPNRIWAADLERAVVPILAQVVHRRAAACAELSNVLGIMRRRYGSVSEGFFSLVWEALCNGVDFLGQVSVGLFSDEHAQSLERLVSGGVDLSVLSTVVPSSIEVVQVVGAGTQRDYGGFIPQLPSVRPNAVDRALAKARAYFSRKAVGLSGRGRQAQGFLPDGAGGEDSDLADGTVAVSERVLEQELDESERVELKGKLFSKLMAEQDALVVARPPRVVHRYEGTDVVESGVVPVPEVDVALMQDDYDDAFPGVSTVDAEAVPFVAAVSDTDVVRETHMSINDSKREIPKPKYIRRARLRGGAAGVLPRSQIALVSALGKRNVEVPMNRGDLDFGEFPAKCVERIQEVCFVDNWREILARELDSGLWQPNDVDLKQYVDKVEPSKAQSMLDEFFSLSDVDMKRWIVMTKGKAKPPLDEGAATKVPLPQTIMYNESKSMNAMFSSMMSRFHDVVDAMTLPNVSFNARHSPADHEFWFNSLQALRASVPVLHKFQGDTFSFDRSLELAAFTVELQFYRACGLNEETLALWKQTMGVKKAVSLMHGVVMHIVLQGLSGIFKTLFRNGLVTLAAIVMCTGVTRENLVSLDVKGDDYTIETNAPLDTAAAARMLAWGFNFSAKFFESDHLYFCSKYWVFVDGWWYWVADPDKKFESLAAAVSVDDRGDTKLSEKWVSLRDDLRHYDNGVVMEALANVVYSQTRRSRVPFNLVYGLGTLARDRDKFFSLYGPVERLGI